jgi:hypothetical protein
MCETTNTPDKTPIWPPVAVGQPIPYGHPMTEELKNGPYGDRFTFEGPPAATPATLHPFELAGLGEAPFRFLRVTENVYCAPGCPPKAGGSCDYCGTGIRWEFWVRGRKGPEFKVGCDCIYKLGRADNVLVGAVQRAAAKLAMEKRRAAREAKYQAQVAKRKAEEQAQRERNGGLTDKEVAKAKAEAEARAMEAAMEGVNGWLVDVLRALPYYSDFVESMRRVLAERPAAQLSPKQLTILRDIYAKAHGRRGSKAYEAAVVDFETRTEV